MRTTIEDLVLDDPAAALPFLKKSKKRRGDIP